MTFRRLFWVEHGESILSCFPLPISDVMIPLENFLQPPETDVSMLRHYLQGETNVAGFVAGFVAETFPYVIESQYNYVSKTLLSFHLNLFLRSSLSATVKPAAKISSALLDRRRPHFSIHLYCIVLFHAGKVDEAAETISRVHHEHRRQRQCEWRSRRR